MKKYLKFFVAIIIFAVVIILAINGYNNLRNKFFPEYSEKTNKEEKKGEDSMKEITLTNENFEEALQNNGVMLVDFWATWCGPCKMLSPVISEIAEEYEGKVTVGKINVDEEVELATKYGITSIPTLILFKDGQVINTTVGFLPKSEIEKMINEAL